MFFHYISHPQRFCVCKFRVLRFVFYHIYRKKIKPVPLKISFLKNIFIPKSKNKRLNEMPFGRILNNFG